MSVVGGTLAVAFPCSRPPQVGRKGLIESARPLAKAVCLPMPRDSSKVQSRCVFFGLIAPGDGVSCPVMFWFGIFIMSEMTWAIMNFVQASLPDQ